MNVIGWYIEEHEGRPGFSFVLVQPGQTREQCIEHVASTPDELWDALEAIANAPALPPSSEVHDAEVVGDDELDEDGNPIRNDEDVEYEDEDALEGTGTDLRSVATDAAQGMVTEVFGPMLGRIAGNVIRNPERSWELLRAISRKDRR
jgi:hypothetical protein